MNIFLIMYPLTAILANYIKATTPNLKVIFIAHCAAKKIEAQIESVKLCVGKTDVKLPIWPSEMLSRF